MNVQEYAVDPPQEVFTKRFNAQWGHAVILRNLIFAQRSIQQVLKSNTRCTQLVHRDVCQICNIAQDPLVLSVM